MATATKNKAVSENLPKRGRKFCHFVFIAWNRALETDSCTNLRASPAYMANVISFGLTHYIHRIVRME